MPAAAAAAVPPAALALLAEAYSHLALHDDHGEKLYREREIGDKKREIESGKTKKTLEEQNLRTQKKKKISQKNQNIK